MLGLLWRWVKSILFLMDAEVAHRFVVGIIRALSLGFAWTPRRTRQGLVDLRKVGSPLGLAAGFDKDCEILLALPFLGFGFAEIGTVTLLPQPGNPRPRLFRSAKDETLFNRMGFNSKGAAIVSSRLRKVRERLPTDFAVGVNLGKNKDTPLEKSAQDYCECAAFFEDLADYLVVNVSSPNTPGLRSLQTVDALVPIVDGLKKLTSTWKLSPPIFLKLAPELSGESLISLVRALEPHGVDGWVLTNTLAGTFSLSKGGTESLSGGWSGKLLALKSREALKTVRSVSQKKMISVGGVDSVEEAERRMADGADLVQIYSGWVFGGPFLPRKISTRLKNR